ncbi:MAG TPA: EamA family transporter [Sedimenticola sp.]|nr:EamA family transporter [Sedimenticola sp.]
MNWLGWTLLSAFCLASADALTKARLADYSARELLFVRLTLTGLLTAPLLIGRSWPELPPAFWGWVVAMVPLEIAAMLLYVRAIRDHPLSQTLPYLAFTPVFVTLSGALLLGETVSPRGMGGILLVAAGAWLLNTGNAGAGNWLTPFSALLRNPGSRMMLGVAAIYSITSVGGKGAMQYLPPELFGPFYFLCVGLILLPILGLTTPARLRRVWRRPLPVLGTATLMGGMLLAHFIAIDQVEVAYMIAVKRSSMLFGILYGALLFREREAGRHLLAGAIMLGGVILIALA